MENDVTYKDIEDYWHYNTISYTIFTDKTLHYGLWDENTETSVEAHDNTNKFIAKLLQLNENDIVLDAGCGVGGVSIYYAKNYGSKVTGITISQHQVELATQNAADEHLSNQVNFANQNYVQTEFEDERFTKVFALESSCYATKKIDFLKEAYRLLKPGGRIAVIDAFVLKPHLSEKERKEYSRFLESWAVPNLALRDQFEVDLKTVGFKDVEYFDKKQEAMKTIKTVYWNGLLAAPLTWVLSKLGWIPHTVHQTAIGGIAQKRIIDLGIVTYGAFTARK